MPEHYLGDIEFKDDMPGSVLRRIICGCGHECEWSDIWLQSIESYAEHRVQVVVAYYGGDNA
jgi:hypothetical protein